MSGINILRRLLMKQAVKDTAKGVWNHDHQ
jgi:hypothetical protein